MALHAQRRQSDDDLRTFPTRSNMPRRACSRRLIAEGILPNDPEATYRSHSFPGIDDTWTPAACYLIAKRKPNLLLLHLLIATACITIRSANAGRLYGRGLCRRLCRPRAGGDRCGRHRREDRGLHRRRPWLHHHRKGPATQQPAAAGGLAEGDRAGKIEDARVYVVPEGGVGVLYITDPAIDAAARQKIRDLFVGREGIADGDRGGQVRRIRTCPTSAIGRKWPTWCWWPRTAIASAARPTTSVGWRRYASRGVARQSRIFWPPIRR